MAALSIQARGMYFSKADGKYIGHQVVGEGREKSELRERSRD